MIGSGNVDKRVQVGRPDYLLLASAVALLVVGTVMVYSASFVVAHNEFNDDLYFLTRQLRGIAVGAVALFVAWRVDYARWRAFSLVALIGCVALLLLVLVPGVGSRSYGSVRWIRVGGVFDIQPSEIAKLAMVLYLADWLARRGHQVKGFTTGLLPFVIIVGMVAGLVELQPDLGTTSIIVGTAAAVFFVAGANVWHFMGIVAAGLAFGWAMILRVSGYRQDRIAAFLDPWSDLQGIGWHTAQTLIALGSGGLTGIGLGGSRQKFYWVPNAHTDAIFAIIGEELGFVGSTSVLLLFGLFAWRGYLVAWRATDPFGRLLATGITSMVMLQAAVNIAVVTNSIPFTGVTLPFLSYGSSSIVVTMFGVGMLMNISRFRGAYVEEAPAPEPEMQIQVTRRPPLASAGMARLAARSGAQHARTPRAASVRGPGALRPRRGTHTWRRESRG